MRNSALTIIFSIASMTITIGQSFNGDWKGILDVQGTKLNLVLHIQEVEGIYTSTLDSPNQGAFGIKMDETSVTGNEIIITMKQMQMKLVGKLNPETNSISATFNQGPMSLPLELTPESAKNDPIDDSNLLCEICGDWNGAIEVMGTTLRLVFHITEKDGIYSSTLDSPDQSSFGIAMDETIVDGNGITIRMKRMQMETNGTYNSDSNIIEGHFNQGSMKLPLTLTREEIAKKVVNRPQEPTSFDYIQEEVKFKNENGGHFLAGTLTMPKDSKFDKVAILVTGSGPQNRNEELLEHKPFLILSDYLTKEGIAVLRYDDRGVGSSEGDFKAATSNDFALDAEAAMTFLKNKAETAGKKYGIIGHSEGGMIAPIVASRTDIDFIVLLAGPGIQIKTLLAEQSEAILRTSRLPEEEIQFSLEVSDMIFEYLKNNPELILEELTNQLSAILRKEFEKLPQSKKDEIGDIEAEIKKQVEGVTSPWFRYFIGFQPSDFLKQVKCPLLAINGSNDLQVLSKSNLAGIKKAMEESGHKNFHIQELSGLNHLFQRSETGAPSEYGSIEETFNEEALKIIADWVKKFDK